MAQNQDKWRVLERPEVLEQVYKLCLLGYNNRELAIYLDISEKVFNEWKSKNICGLGNVVKKGKDEADANVSEALYKTAIGFYVEVDKPFFNQKTGKVILKRMKEYYPPNSQAALKWLALRHRDKWSQNEAIIHHTVEHKKVDEVSMEGFSDEEKEFMQKVLQKQLTDGSEG